MASRVWRYRTTTPVPATVDVEDVAALVARFAAVRAEQHVPEAFPPEVLAEADDAAAHVALPDRDETAVPFCTIDPPGSMDLDQALHIERDGDGHRVRYAIADVPAVVRPGGAIDVEARRRGTTVYCPDERAPLHPPRLSEDAASLLPGQVRSAFVWDLRLDATGEVTAHDLYRARVRSTDRLDYAQVQHDVDAGTADERLVLLKQVGERRIALERARGGASLPLPEQQVDQRDDGGYTVTFRPPVPAEDWNAQLSLMTGMVAARIMLDGRVGLLRTMPAPDGAALARFRRQAAALGADWPTDLPYGELLRRLDLADPRHLALVHEATSLFRGAGYTPFDGELPTQQEHAAVAAPYAHVTAPLRRLVDRFGLVVCAALAAGEEVPAWVREALPELPGIMRGADQRASAVERACTDAVEAAVMGPRVGQTFPASVVDRKEGRVVVQLSDPAILGDAADPAGRADLGDRVTVRCTGADVTTGKVALEVTS
ncbi:RNB domain-containing ribonuclease [Lapillicoccus jejuensis]|uniref:Exoribonuclease R n=1 Tax=Lapillicoccus jejuensis TaxID=402171 RepID=A0A542E5Z2_9MICO|nr:RNB domain-containing ribonuclease [Lapillicoccus jejuensis]TQJ10750.1 exoribonuclease R [Lapillicoccus jejuensis]